MASEGPEMSKLGTGGKQKESLIVCQDLEVRRLECGESQRDDNFVQHWIISCL